MNKDKTQFVVCIHNQDYTASLELRKIYAVVPDSGAEAHGMIRLVDESGEDYVDCISQSRWSCQHMNLTSGAVLSIVTVTMMLLTGCYSIAPRDADRNGPEDVARRFVECARAKDYVGAASCWHTGDVKNIEANRNISFEKYCEYYECDSYRVLPEKIEKRIYWVSFEGWKDGKRKARWLFFEHPSKESDGRWRLTESRWIP